MFCVASTGRTMLLRESVVSKWQFLIGFPYGFLEGVLCVSATTFLLETHIEPYIGKWAP